MKGAPGATQQMQEDESRGGRYQADSYQDEPSYGPPGGYQPQQLQSSRAAPAHQRAPSASQQQQQQQQQRRPPPAAAPSAYSNDPNDSFTGGGAGVPEGADEVVDTYPCPNCERRFNEVALQKHIAKQICSKKPRKAFDMAAQRLENLAQEAREAGIALPIKGRGGAAPAKAAAAGPPKKVSKWRADHEKFMAAIQAGRQMQAALDAGVPLASIPTTMTREEDDDRTPCPHWLARTMTCTAIVWISSLACFRA